MSSQTYRPLFGNAAFRRLMPVFALSDLGDGMSTVAVAWLALTIGSGTLVGFAVAVYILPGAIGALVLGRWMRRLSARWLLVADGWLRAVLLGAIPVLWALDALTPSGYLGLLGASSLLHAWGKAGKHALFAPLLPEDQRLAANSLLSTSIWVSVIAGPVLAGVLATAVSPAWIIGLDAITFAVLAIQAGRTQVPAVPAAAAPGLRILLRQRELLGLLVVTWFFNLAFGPVEAALPLFVSQDMHAGSGLLGSYWAVFGVGAVIGALSLGFARKLPLWPVMLGIIAIHGLALLPFAYDNHPAPSLIGFTVAGVIYGPYSALSFTLMQDRTPAESLTTVLAARSAVLLTASPAGAALGGLLVNSTGAGPLIVGSGVAMIALAGIAALVRGS